MTKRHHILLAGVSFAAVISASNAVFAANAETPAGQESSSNTGQNETDVTLPAVSVIDSAGDPTADQKLQRDGTAEQGYAAKTLSGLGPWGQKDVLDTPYQASIVSSDLIENLQAHSIDDLAKIEPTLQTYAPTNHGTGANFTLRGFGTASFGSSSAILQTQDGFRAPGLNIQDLEDKERVEVLTGVTGFLTGENAPGGSINFVQKRPTAQLLADVTVGDAGGGRIYEHVDFGGPVSDGGRIGYRLNAVNQNGDSDVSGQSVTRRLLSVATDFHVADNALLQFNLGYDYNHIRSVDSYWTLGSASQYPSAPDTSKNWGEKWSYAKTETYEVDTKFTWDVVDGVTSRTGIQYIHKDSDWLGTWNNINEGGKYSQDVYLSDRLRTKNLSAYQYIDWKFGTFGAGHKVTTGINGYKQDLSVPIYWWAGNDAAWGIVSGDLNGDPTYTSAPDANTLGIAGYSSAQARRSSASNKNILVGDDIAITEQVTLLLGVGHSQIQQSTFVPTTGSKSAGYNKSAEVPALSLIYKPIPSVSTYVSYLEGLDQGATAPTQATYTNRGQIMAPSISKDYEAGVKTDHFGFLSTLNFFDVKRAYDYGRNNGNGTYTYVQDGEEEHKGVEFSVTGKITRDLTLFGGATWMSPEVTKSQTLNGKRPWDVADTMAKLYAEYDIRALPGFTVTGGVNYVGGFYADAANTAKLPGFTTGDLGARFTTDLYGTRTIFRLNITNIMDKSYWLTSSYLGQGRTALFSATAKF